MIVGEPGTGKSSIAQSLALLRLILFATGIDIVDPDLDNNLTRRTWVAGKAYGGRKDGPFPEQLESYFENLLDQEFPESQGHTAIFDEISKWTSSLRVNPKDAEGYIRHLYTTFRRKSIWSIMLLHGIQQDYNLPGCSAGTLTNIFPYAGIIKIEAAKDTLGKTKFSQVAKFKRPGQPMTDDNWEDILIRPSFHASKIVEMMGRGADYFGVGVETPGSLAQAQAMAQMVDILEEAIPTNQDLVARLEFLREQQIQAPHNLPEEELCVDTDLLNSSQCELVNRFYEFMTKKTTSVQPKDDGFYLVREIWRNWGYKQDSWKSVADFKDWLKLLEKANVGAIKANGQSWRWRFLKGFKGVK
jgi:adenylate kinase family enzyme